MQVQTLTITTERQETQGDLFRITSFEMTTTAICDVCAKSAGGTRQSLKDTGWTFGNGAEFCPDCN